MSAVAAVAVTTDADGTLRRRATSRARLAVVGMMLRETEADNGQPGYIVIEGALTHSFFDLAALKGWVKRHAGGRGGAVA